MMSTERTHSTCPEEVFLTISGYSSSGVIRFAEQETCPEGYQKTFPHLRRSVYYNNVVSSYAIRKRH